MGNDIWRAGAEAWGGSWRFRGVVLGVMSLGMVSCGQEQAAPVPVARKGAESPAPPVPEADEVDTDSEEASAASQAADASTPAMDPDVAYREAVVGVWKQSNTGVRWLRVRPDGTATMYIDPDWIAQAIIGDSLTMQIKWSIDEGRAVMNSVSGKPQSAFEAVTTLFGRERNRPIVELNEERFVLRDEEDGSLSKWTRVEPGAAMPEAVES